MRFICDTQSLLKKPKIIIQRMFQIYRVALLTGATIEEVEAHIREAIEFHLDGLREDGTPPPQPSSHVEYVEVAA